MDDVKLQERSKLLNLTLDLPRMRINEIVLRTSRYTDMKAWYQGMLGVAPYYERAAPKPTPGETPKWANRLGLCFFRVQLEFPYTQVVALFDTPDLRPAEAEHPGLHHMQFRVADIGQLCERYGRLKCANVTPFRTMNHGSGISFYYRDPDANVVELSAITYEREDEYLKFLDSDAFLANPSGVAINADDLVRRYMEGESLSALTRI